MRFILITVIISFTAPLYCQAQMFKLSPGSLARIKKASNGRDRLLTYYKNFKRDSIRFEKTLLKKFKSAVDSAVDLQERVDVLDRQRGTLLHAIEGSTTDTARTFLESQPDDLRTLENSSGESYFHLTEEMPSTTPVVHGDEIPSLDPDSVNYRGLIRQFRDDPLPPNLIENLRDQNDRVSDRIEQYEEIDHRIKEPLERVPKVIEDIPAANPEAALDNPMGISPALQDTRFPDLSEATAKGENHLLEKFGTELEHAQNQLSKMMSRYRRFSNVSDTKGAIRHSSLKGEPLTDRIHASVMFNPVSFSPPMLDVAPYLGFKINKRFIAGTAVNIRLAAIDSVATKGGVSAGNLSYKLFANYTVFNSFFAHAEFESSRVSLPQTEGSYNKWQKSYFAGVGRRTLVHPKIYFTVMALYNITPREHSAVHPSRFQVRVGVERSELSRKRKRILYNPNK